jgi:hypothetical protein
MTKISQNDLRALVRETVAKKLGEGWFGGGGGAAAPQVDPGAKAHIDRRMQGVKEDPTRALSIMQFGIQKGEFGPESYDYMYSELEKAGAKAEADKLRDFIQRTNPQMQSPIMDSAQRNGTRITEQELRALIDEAVAQKLSALKEGKLLKEADDPKSEPGTMVPSAKAVVAFSKKCDDLITKMIEEIRKLADDGEELIDPNLLNAPETGSRNELVIHRVGMLRTTANGLATFFERVRRSSP